MFIAEQLGLDRSQYRTFRRCRPVEQFRVEAAGGAGTVAAHLGSDVLGVGHGGQGTQRATANG